MKQLSATFPLQRATWKVRSRRHQVSKNFTTHLPRARVLERVSAVILISGCLSQSSRVFEVTWVSPNVLFLCQTGKSCPVTTSTVFLGTFTWSQSITSYMQKARIHGSVPKNNEVKKKEAPWACPKQVSFPYSTCKRWQDAESDSVLTWFNQLLRCSSLHSVIQPSRQDSSYPSSLSDKTKTKKQWELQCLTLPFPQSKVKFNCALLLLEELMPQVSDMNLIVF